MMRGGTLVIKCEARVQSGSQSILENRIQSAWSETWHPGCFQKFPRQCVARVENLWWFFGQKDGAFGITCGIFSQTPEGCSL